MEVVQDFISEGRVNRPGSENSCEYITIHDTGNTRSGADAKAHAKYIKNATERTSWHYTVDDGSIYQHLPDDEKSYHTSKAEANENSIAIELCVNADGDFAKTVDNAVWLVHTLCKKYGIPVSNIMSHKDWTGKNCPATLLKNGWDEFIKRCSEEDQPQKEKAISTSELRELGYTSIIL